MPNRACVSIVLALAAGGVAQAQELYRQDPVNSFGGLAAQDARNPGGLGWFAEVVDNFNAQAGWVVGSIEFWGGYAADIPGNTHGFMIRFYEDNGGAVGNLLLTQDVMTFTETEYYQVVFPPPLGVLRGYHYTLDLATPFAVPAGGSYWMSVTAILDRGGGSTEPQWGWVQATSIAPPPCQQWFFSPGNFSPQSQDVSFVLKSGAVACYPDCDGDAALTLADFGCFQTKFALGDLYADCNGDTVLNLADFGCFQTAFALGCP